MFSPPPRAVKRDHSIDWRINESIGAAGS